MTDYTLQKDLDVVQLGERWGCAFTNPINAFEHYMGRKLYLRELERHIGRCFMKKIALMCNYKNDATAVPQQPELPGWDATANPEWHYYVKMWDECIVSLSLATGRSDFPHEEYRIAIMSVPGNHYTLMLDNGRIINPDPGLVGKVIEIRPLLA